MEGRQQAISAILLAVVITTGVFVPFVQPATAQNESPAPTLDDVDIPDEVTVGESFEVVVDASNDGGRAGAYSTITVSSPDLDESGDGSQVTVTDDFDHSYSAVSDAGDEIFDKNGDSLTAEYALAEAGTVQDTFWDSGESRSFATEITPEETGTLEINVRTTLVDDEDSSEKYTAPSSGPEDQQGYTIKQYEVEVKEETEISAEIEDVDPPSGDYTPGEDATAETTIRNTGNVEHEFYVGYSVRGPDGEWRDNDRSTHESVWVEPGEEETIDVEWEVEDDAPTGEYDIWTSVYRDADGDQLEDRLDESRMMDVFEVETETEEYRLNADTDGEGGLEVDPPGFSTTSVDRNYEEGTEVELTAKPGPDSRFVEWSGDLGSADEDDRTIEVTMNEARDITAEFEEETEEYRLNADTDGEGGFEVDPPGFSTTSVDRNYEEGTKVELTAKPGPDSRFVGWNGDVGFADEKDRTIEVTMNEARDITAEFEEETEEYRLNADTDGEGGFELYPPGFSTTSVDREYEEGTTVELTATPGPDSRFVEWTGDIGSTDGDESTIEVTMDEARDITARFEEVSREYRLEANTDGDGGFEVYPPGFSTTSVDREYEEGTSVELTATPGPDSRFVEWTGDIGFADETDRTIEVTMDKARDITAEFKEETEVSAEIEDVNPPSGDYTAGEEIVTEATIRNTGNVEHEFYVGYSVRGPDDEWRDNDRSTHESVWVEPGEEETVDVEWEVESDAPTGEYDIWTSVNGNLSGDQLENRLDDKQLTNVFDIVSENSPPTIEVNRPERGTNEPLDISVGDTTDFSVTTTDPDSNLETVRWFVDGELRDIVEVGGGRETSTFTTTFGDAGSHSVTAVAMDKDGQLSDPVEWSISAEEAEANALIESVDWPTGEYQVGDEVTTKVRIQNTGEQEQTFHVGYSVQGRQGDWKDNDESTHTKLTLSSGETQPVEVTWEVTEEASPGSYDTLVAIYADQRDDDLVNRLDETSELETFSVETARPTVGLDITELPQGEFTPGDTVKTTAEVQNTGNEESTYTVGYRLYGPEGRLMESTTPQEITLQAAERDKITLSRTIPSDAPGGDFDVKVTVTAEDEGEPISVADFSQEEVFTIDTSDIGVGSVKFADETVVAGQKTTGEVSLRNPTDSTQEYQVTAVLVDPNGIEYPTDSNTINSVSIPADTSDSVDFDWRIQDRLPTGAYDMHVKVWPAGEPRSESTRLAKIEREGIIKVATRKEERVSVGAISVNQQTVAPPEDLETTFEVTNTGSETRTFTVTTGLSDSDNIIESERRQVDTITLSPSETKTVSSVFDVDTEAPGGSYDVVVNVFEDDTEITERVSEDMFDVFSESYNDVRIGGIYSDPFVSSGDKIETSVLVSLDDVDRSLKVEYTLQDPNGNIITPANNQRQLSSGQGVLRLDFTHTATQEYQSGAYDIRFSVTTTDDSEMEQIVAQKTDQEALEVSAEDDGSITVIPTTDFSASVDLIRNGEIVSEKYLYNGEELTFDSLPPGQYTVEYQAVKIGGSASVNRTVELAEDESSSIEIKPDSASFSGTVAIDERPLDDATVVVSGRTDTTDEGGVFEFSPQISPGYHTLLVKYDGRTIYRESIQIESGENSQNIEIEYVDPYPNDEFDGEEFLLGAACGQLCTTVGDDEHDNAEYMIGWLVGGFNPVADVRDGLVSAGSGDVVGVGLSVIGLAPYYGDSLSISGRLSRFVDRATPETLYNLREIVRQSSLNGKEKFTNRLYQNSDIRSTLDSKYGVSRSTTKRLGDSRVRKLRAAAGRLGKAGYSDESIGRLIRNHRNKPSKIEELSFSAKYYKDATGSRPKSNSEMLEAVWLNRIRVSESANIARQTAYLGDLSSGNTYVASGVELAEGGELDTVLFRVGEDGDATVLRTWEAGVGSLDNKPSRQLRTNLANAERGGSSSHDYLDAEAFSRRSMEDKHAGYVGFTDEYDQNLVDEAVPDGGEPVYGKAEYNKMNQDLGIDIQSPVENIGSSKMRVVIERGS